MKKSCLSLLKVHFLPIIPKSFYFQWDSGSCIIRMFSEFPPRTTGVAKSTRTELYTCPYLTSDLQCAFISWFENILSSRTLLYGRGTCVAVQVTYMQYLHLALTAYLKQWLQQTRRPKQAPCSTINVNFIPHWFISVLWRKKKKKKKPSKLYCQRRELFCIMLQRGLATKLKSHRYNEQQGFWWCIMSVEIIFLQSRLLIVCTSTPISPSIVTLKIGWKLVEARANEMLPSITSATTKQTRGWRWWFEWAISAIKLTCAQNGLR